MHEHIPRVILWRAAELNPLEHYTAEAAGVHGTLTFESLVRLTAGGGFHRAGGQRAAVGRRGAVRSTRSGSVPLRCSGRRPGIALQKPSANFSLV